MVAVLLCVSFHSFTVIARLNDAATDAAIETVEDADKVSKAPAKPVPPTAPGAHDGGLEYGVIAPDVAADNMAAHIAAMPEDMPPPTTLTAHAAWMAEHEPFSPEAYETVEDAAKDRAVAAAAAAALVPSSELIITKSGFKGILKHRGKYRAQFMENGSIRYLGIFATPEDAAICYALREAH